MSNALKSMVAIIIRLLIVFKMYLVLVQKYEE